MSKRSRALQKFQQERRNTTRTSRVKQEKTTPLPVSVIAPKPESPVMLTRKLTGKRTISATRNKPTGYTSQTKTGDRGSEQSKKTVLHPLRHTTKPRSLLLDPARQHRVENGNERLQPFIWAPREKAYKITPRSNKPLLQMTVYAHDGMARVNVAMGQPLQNTLRERK